MSDPTEAALLEDLHPSGGLFARLGRWFVVAYTRRPALFVFACTFLIYAMTASWSQVGNSDVQASVLPAYQLAATGTPWLDDLPYSRSNPFFIEANGHIVTNRQIGIVLLGVPFYLLTGHPLAVWPSALAAVTATAGAVTMMHLALRSIVPVRAAWGATAVMAVATPTWTVSADGLWSHTMTQLTISAAALAASRNRWWLVGCTLGFGIMARPHLAVVPLVLGLGVGWARKSWRIPMAVGLPALAATAILIGLNRWIYGQWTLTGYASYVSAKLGGLGGLGGIGGDKPSEGLSWEALNEYLVNWAGFLIAPNRGLFIWTPIALVLLPAAWRARRSAPDWVLALVVGGFAYTGVQLWINHFHGVDAFFGYRHPLELVTCALPLYAIAWSRTTSPAVRGTVAGLSVVQGSFMLLGAIRSVGWLSASSVWTDNAIAYLARELPVVMIPILLLVALTAWRVGIQEARTASHDRESVNAKPS